MKSFIYGHIHPCRWIKITLYFKFQAQSAKLRLYAHAQAIFVYKDVENVPKEKCIKLREENGS
jgi:hypothetical protein